LPQPGLAKKGHDLRKSSRVFYSELRKVVCLRSISNSCFAALPLIASIALGCGTGPRVESEEQLVEIPSMPLSQLLGKPRADVETLFHPAEAGHAEGWVRYNDHLEVRYEQGRCVEFIQLVPAGLSCSDAARWVGFGDAMAPIFRAKACVWPPNSLKHSLGSGVSGDLSLEGGAFRAQLDSR
jgi:hypothetical protein